MPGGPEPLTYPRIVDHEWDTESRSIPKYQRENSESTHSRPARVCGHLPREPGRFDVL